MEVSDAPRSLRGSLPESLAYEQGSKAGSVGLGADANPYSESSGPDDAAIHDHSGGYHALRNRPSGLWRHRGGYKSKCGVDVIRLYETWNGNSDHACKRCIAVVEAGRRRLERSWESGRMSTHPK